MNKYGIVALIVFMATAGCENNLSRTLEPQLESRSLSTVADHVPERNNKFTEMSDSVLFDRLAVYDTVAVIGIKAPGERRGIWKGEKLAGPEIVNLANGAIRNQPGVEYQRGSEFLPIAIVKITSVDALSSLRRLPFVDYVEPNQLVPAGEFPYSSGSGCSGDTWAGQTTTFTVGSGDLAGAAFQAANIDKAWARGSNGAGIDIALLDTGISNLQPEFNSTTFSSGDSSGRSIALLGISNTSYDPYSTCDHGNEMAGVIAAPKNGSNVVGVAWKSNFVSVHQSNSVGPLSAVDVSDALGYGGQQLDAWSGRNIVTMAFKSWDTSSAVSDLIRFYHAFGDFLFIAAAGTTADTPLTGNVIFPAEMPEVVAVTGLKPGTMTPCNSCHTGPELELSMYTPTITTGKYINSYMSLGSSSGATATVAGIAALVWSTYPTLSSEGVRLKLRQAANGYPNRTNSYGYGLVDAYKAVGGYTALYINAPNWVQPYSSVSATANAYGDGPFAYQWSNGATTSSTTYNVGGDNTCTTISVTVTDLHENIGKAATQEVNVSSKPPNPGACA